MHILSTSCSVNKPVAHIFDLNKVKSSQIKVPFRQLFKGFVQSIYTPRKRACKCFERNRRDQLAHIVYKLWSSRTCSVKKAFPHISDLNKVTPYQIKDYARIILLTSRPLLGDQCVGLYRDDGLAIMKDATGHDADRTRKQLIQILQAHGLKVTIETNKKIVDYLDMTLKLAIGTFQPYRKPKSPPLYVDLRSCYPPQVLRQIPIGINKRLQRISCNEEVFNDAKTLYEDALASSGHPKTMTYKDEPSKKKKKAKKGRNRDVIWFNPPYSTTVKTNVGAKFLYLVKKHFPEGSALHKVFN